jgi:hypothetical protein
MKIVDVKNTIVSVPFCKDYPLARYRELDVLFPRLDRMGVEVQLFTSAVRPLLRARPARPALGRSHPPKPPIFGS